MTVDFLFAALGLSLGFGGMQLAYVAGLQRGRSERATDPTVVSFVPTSLTVPPAPYRGPTTTGDVAAGILVTAAPAGLPIQLSLSKAPLAPYRRNAGEAA